MVNRIMVKNIVLLKINRIIYKIVRDILFYLCAPIKVTLNKVR